MKQTVLSRLVLGLVFSCASVKSDMMITWNGTTVTGPVLIYHDEISVDTGPYTVVAYPSFPGQNGILLCKNTNNATVHWRTVEDTLVRVNNNDSGNGDFRQLRSAISYSRPSVSRLIVTREGINRSDVTVNGLWPCRLNNMIEGSLYVGIYRRGGGGHGPVIRNNNVSIGSSDSQTFTLFGDTSGGPPTTYTWTRDGVSITNGGSFSISIGVNLNPGNGLSPLVDSTYQSTLTVTGRLPGVYQYSVTNRATPTMVTGSINIAENLSEYYLYDVVAPVDFTVTILSDTSVQLSWERLPIPEITGYIVYFSVKGQSSELNVTVSSSENSVVISGLATNMEYQFEVVAVAGEFFIRGRSIRINLLQNNKGVTNINTGAIAGGVVSLFIIICSVVVIVLVCCVCHSYKNKNEDADMDMKTCAAYGNITLPEQSHQTEEVYETVT